VTRIGLTIAQSAKSSGGTKPWGTTGPLAWGRRDNARSDRAITACPTAAEDGLRALALGSSRVELSDSLHAVVILAQPRSMIVDFLELTGMGNLEARELIPELSE
jgi:hypothetical protein